MTVGSLVLDRAPAGYDLAPDGYLRSVVAVTRSARRGEFVVVHFGSGSFFRTDRLGALTARALIDGKAGAQAMELAERVEAGAGERARRLICLLGSTGAMTLEPSARSAGRWSLRWIASTAIGICLSVLGPLARIAPISVLAWIFRSWPATPMARHVWNSSRVTVVNNLLASGYVGQPEEWLVEVGRRSASEPSRGYLFAYLGMALPPKRLNRLVDLLFDRDSVDGLAANMQASGPTVGAFLHGPLCVAVPTALRTRGQEAVRVITPRTHGINVAERSGTLGEFFGDSTEASVNETDPNASGALLRHLKAGRSVYVALDKVALEGKAAKIEMVGRCLARNDGPAWLAVVSGRPLALWTTHASSSGVVITASPLLHPDPSLPVGLRVANLSERLYACAEATIREHPEAWWCWTYSSLPGEEPQP